MSTLTKQTHGIIYSEGFEEPSLIWSLSPSNLDCLRFEYDGLHILHSKKYVMYTMQESDDPYCLIAEIEHTPIHTDDIAGIIVFSNTNDYAECQTYLSDSPSNMSNYGSNIGPNYDFGSEYVRYSFDDDNDGSEEQSDPSSHDEENEDSIEYKLKHGIYRFLRMIKYNNESNFLYQFFASIDGIEWIEVGSTTFKTKNQIGFFLYATREQSLLQNGKFVIKNLNIYKNPYITIHGISNSYDFEIFDENYNSILKSDIVPWSNFISRYGNRVEINTNSMYLPIKNGHLRIYSKADYSSTIAEYDLDNYTFGGDIFNINYDIKLYDGLEEIDPGIIHELGTLFTDSFKKQIYVHNNEDFDLSNIKVSIIPYSEYFTGSEVVKMAIYDGNIMEEHPKAYEYNNTIIINKLDAHSSIELVLKLSEIPKQDFYSVANNYRFRISIEFI